MVFNWTLEVYLSFLSVILTFAASILIFVQNRRNPDRALVVMSISYFGLSMYFLFSGLGYLLLNLQVSMIKNIFLVIMCISITMTTNQMIFGKFTNGLLVAVSFFSAFAISIYLLPIEENIQRTELANGQLSLTNVGFNRLILAILFMYIIVDLLYFTIKIFRYSPLGLRRNSSLYFIGNILLIIATLTFVTGLSITVPGLVEILVSAGILISSIGLIRAPQILYVLPFSAIKLSIIRADSGISFYNYYWQGDLDVTAEQLFGAAFLAITNFMSESVGEGNIQEVKLEGATMTISKSLNQAVYFVVIATKPSYVLAKGLEQFSKSFIELYGDLLTGNHIHDIQQFQEADKLIPICFPYIPKE